MSLRGNIRDALTKECDKRVRKHFRNIALRKRGASNFRRRTGLPAIPINFQLPEYWDEDPQFNPFYVRKRLKIFEHAITNSLQDYNYEPHPAFRRIIETNGKKRIIDIFTLPDAAVSYWLWDTIHQRESIRLGGAAFAYRKDYGRNKAVEHIQYHLNSADQHYIVEADFKNYFNSISHNSLFRLFKELDLNISKIELNAIEKILQHNYFGPEGSGQRESGIPLGSSISLLLANIACIQFDHAVTKTGAVLFRFADDVIAFADSLTQAEDVWKTFISEAAKIGVKLNFDKSKGISHWSQSNHLSHIKRSEEIEFLGYAFKPEQPTRIRNITINKFKMRCTDVIFKHLLMEFNRGNQINVNRISAHGTDWDLMRCINELNWIIHGQSNAKDDLRQAQGIEISTTFTGWLKFFPHANDYSQCQELDYWLIDEVIKIHRTRRRYLNANDYPYIPADLNADILMNGTWYHNEFDDDRTLSFPSLRASLRKLIRVRKHKGIKEFPEQYIFYS